MEKTVALVLSSGGSRGLAQIVAINELEKQGFHISSVSGSSIGAVIGRLYAMGKLDEYSQWVSSFSRRDVWGFMDFTLTSHGLIKGERVFDSMETFIPDMNIEDMNLPFSAVATDIINEKEVVFTRGSFYEAVRASVALPAVFTPVKYKDTILLDGDILNPVPIDQVVRKPGDMLVVVNLYRENKLTATEKDVEKDYLNGSKKTLTTIISTGEKHRMNYDSANTFDFYKAKKLIELGQNETKRAHKNNDII